MTLYIMVQYLHGRYIFRWECLRRIRDKHACFSDHAITDGRNFNRPISRHHFRFLYKVKMICFKKFIIYKLLSYVFCYLDVAT